MVLIGSRLFTKLLNNIRKYSVITKNTNEALQLNVTSIQRNPHRYLFWERDRKAGYGTKDKTPLIEQIKSGYKELKEETKLWIAEQKEALSFDPLLVARPGETDLLWCFNDQNVIDKFVTTCDSDHNQGYSTCHLELSKAGRARFHGYLDVRVPKDGRIKKAGYCAIRSKRVRKSFKRDTTYDWNLYNTLVLKVRGDGRSYLLNLSCEGYYDIMWNDIFHYVLYTRGGPYWQVARIPFSKFVLGSKGRLQDKQSRIILNRITHFGISCGDKIPGPYDLEIEYIGLEFDPAHDEEFAYELYKTDKYIVNV